MGQITATRNLVATKVVRHAGQWNNDETRIVNRTPGSKLQWNSNKGTSIFIVEIAFDNVIYKYAAMLFGSHCVKSTFILTLGLGDPLASRLWRLHILVVEVVGITVLKRIKKVILVNPFPPGQNLQTFKKFSSVLHEVNTLKRGVACWIATDWNNRIVFNYIVVPWWEYSWW